MAGTKISGLTALTAGNVASTDLLELVDVSDTTMAASGTNKKVTVSTLYSTVGAVTSAVNTVAATGSTETLDASVYDVHDCTMDTGCTFTFSNPASSGTCSSFVLILRGAFTPVFPGSVKWSSGSAPTYTTPSVYTFTTVDAGTTWYGAQVGKAFA